jgi:chemotaxis protein histidine kinase CheA/CheY-like chemotaxis protein
VQTGKYLKIFVEEGRDLVSRLERDLVRLEREPTDTGAAESALRAAHTLKGSSRMVGLPGVSKAAHGIESIIQHCVNEGRKEACEGIQLLLDVIDRMRAVFDAIEGGETADLTAMGLEELKETGEANGEEIPSGAGEEEGGGAPAEPEPEDKTAKAPKFRLEDEGTSRQRDLRNDGIRVRTDRLDKLFDQVESALVADRKMLGALKALREFYPGFASSHLMGNLVEQFHQQSAMLGEIRQSMMSLRMIPLADLFEGYPRMTRDLASELGKNILLLIDGEDTEVDRNLVEDIRGSLTHLVRNSIDHGIEKPAEREAKGKPPAGTLSIRAYHKPGAVVIEVEDDGRGLDVEELRETAIRKGFLLPSEAMATSDEEIFFLLCRSGFTTRDSADEVSGRGVGLDVVKNTLEKLQGSMTISSEKNSFTRFKLFLPQSMASIRALVVEAGGYRVAIPTLFVEKCVVASAQRLVSRGGLLPYMDERLHVVSLDAILGLQAKTTESDTEVIVMRYRGKRMALAVNKMISEQEILIKDAGEHLRDTAVGILGVTVLEGGVVAPILDIRYMHERWAGLEFSCRMKVPKLRRALNILVVDDAITSRHVVSSILQDMGHMVAQAQDGAEGWKIAERETFDLVVTDLEMPEVDGIELVRRIRRTERTAEMPVIMMSVRSSESVIAKAYGAGVNAFVSKEKFDGNLLRKTLRNLFPDA